MKLGYDNIEDAKTKLVGTYCYYKGKAITIKVIEPLDDAGTMFRVFATRQDTGRSVEFELDSPDFNCSNYNLGYLQNGFAAAWWYRIPQKQYRQGLRYDQVRMKYSKPQFADQVAFKNGKGLTAMLENSYPDLETTIKSLRDNEVNIMAFHKNFAVTYDRIHRDMILEYKGTLIGFTHDFKKCVLAPEHEYLQEALKEAISG